MPSRNHPLIVIFLLLLTGIGLLAFASPAAAVLCARSLPSQEAVCAHRQSLAPSPAGFTPPALPEESILTGVTYGWIEDYAYFYEQPRPGAQHVRTSTSGFFYGPAEASVADANGKRWYKVWDNWLPERYFHIVEPSTFRGVEVKQQPQRPFGWILRPFVPRPQPAADPEAGIEALPRYQFVELHAWTRGADGNVWYDVGPGRWVRYDTVALTTVRERPGDVGPDEYWVDVDLTQQIFAAYEGDRLVYAGLISSGLRRWPTRIGLNQVWQRHETTPMEGGVPGDDYYYIDAVPHTMYFDGEIALHGAFWHDDFGRPKSHGCVNMPPRAAEWVFNWSQDAPNDLWVWVHYADRGDVLQ